MSAIKNIDKAIMYLKIYFLNGVLHYETKRTIKK